MHKKVNLLAHKTWHFVILEYFLKEKGMKNVLPEMYIFNASFIS